MEKKCPYCGKMLPEEVSFCPHCAKSVNQRDQSKVPRFHIFRLLQIAVLVLIVGAIGTGLYVKLRPKTYDAMGEVTYESGGRECLINFYQNGISEVSQVAGDEERYRFPLTLCVNYRDTGENASEEFMQNVETFRLDIEQPEDSLRPVTATEPKPDDYVPYAALVTYIDYNKQSSNPIQFVWNLSMKNGDTIRLRMDFTVIPMDTYNYNPEDADMSDTEALQALIDKIAEEVNIYDIVNINLPAVVYEETLFLHDQVFNLTGSEENGQRTTFKNGIQIQIKEDEYSSWVHYITGIDFVGNGEGIGISARKKVWAKECNFYNLKTGMLCYGLLGWGNATNCVFEGNDIGIHCNLEIGGSMSDVRFQGNQFINNRTGVLLEQLPNEKTLSFLDSVFSGNEIDIDNRCEQPLDLSEAIFE